MYSSQRRSVLLSGLLHAAAIVLVLAVTRVPTQPITRFFHAALLMPRDIVLPVSRDDGGGGGGVRSPLPASQGRLPRQALRQFTPPQVEILNQDPKLPMEPTILVAPDIARPKIDLAQYGIPNGVPGPLSGGPGSGGGIGEGDGTGVGNSRGPGYGDGPGGPGFGRGNAGFRTSITGPVLVWKTEPDYSDEARKAHLQGTVVLRIDVDARGLAQNIRITQSLGMGLDERAVEAVKKWRFRPAMQNGKPVAAPAQIEVFFRLL